MSDAAPVQDRRRSPFCYQTHDALDALRAHFEPGKRATALGIYLVLTETANRHGGEQARGGFTARRKEIAALAGVSLDTLDRYIAGFVEAGVLEVTKTREGAVNLPNVWVLADPPSRTSGVTSPPGVAAPDRHKEPKKELQEEKNLPALVAPKLTKIDGRDIAFDALAEQCGIRQGSPRLREVAIALNGRKGHPEEGIRAQFHAEAKPDIYVTPQGWESELVTWIHRRVKLYRQKMPGAALTPTALAKWWTDLPGLPDPGRGDGRVRPAEVFAEAARLQREGR
jgi:hypothetical protein